MSNISDGLLKRWANVTEGEHIGITRQGIAAMSAEILDLRNQVNMGRIVADDQTARIKELEAAIHPPLSEDALLLRISELEEAGQVMLADLRWKARYNPDVASHTALWMKLTGQK